MVNFAGAVWVVRIIAYITVFVIPVGIFKKQIAEINICSQSRIPFVFADNFEDLFSRIKRMVKPGHAFQQTVYSCVDKV